MPRVPSPLRLFARRERPGSGATRRSKGKAKAKTRRRTTWLGAIFGILAVLLAVAIGDNALHRDKVLRNVSVAGVSIGGSSEDDLRSTLTDLEPRLADLPVELVAGDQAVTTTAGAAGLHIDVDATAAGAIDTGRDGIASPFSWFRGLVRERKAPLRMQIDDAALASALQPFGSTGDDPVRFEVVNGEITVAGGAGGTIVDAEAAKRELLASAARGDTPIRAELIVTDAPPLLTAAQMAAMAAEANEATSSGLRVTLAGEQETVDASTVRGWLRPDVEGLTFTVDTAAVVASGGLLFPDAGGEGTDAVIAVWDNRPLILGGEPATACCAADSGDRVAAALRADLRDVELVFESTPRPRGKEWAESLGITELVGEFTTRYPAGQPRVVNIKRISELTQGAVVEPGEMFSINEYVGKRTTENGFVPAGSIQNGVFEDSVGGGISQYATTLFNAAFFAGLDFGDYQSHSIYISRYPYGREATVSYPQPNLEIINSTPHGIMIWPTATDTSVTVQIFSTRFATGAQTGQSQRPQGAACTKVTTERTRTFVDGREPKIDTVTALYRPEGVSCSGNPTVPTTAPPPTVPPPVETTVPPETTLPVPPTTTTDPSATTLPTQTG